MDVLKRDFKIQVCNTRVIWKEGIVFSGAKIRPHSQWNLGDFFPNFEKNMNLQKKCCFFFVCFLEDWDFHSVNTYIHKLHTWQHSTTIAFYFSFNLMAIVCVIANLFFN